MVRFRATKSVSKGRQPSGCSVSTQPPAATISAKRLRFCAGPACSIPPARTATVGSPARSAARCAIVSMPRAPPLTTVSPSRESSWLSQSDSAASSSAAGLRVPTTASEGWCSTSALPQPTSQWPAGNQCRPSADGRITNGCPSPIRSRRASCRARWAGACNGRSSGGQAVAGRFQSTKAGSNIGAPGGRRGSSPCRHLRPIVAATFDQPPCSTRTSALPKRTDSASVARATASASRDSMVILVR